MITDGSVEEARHDGMCLPYDKVCAVNLTSTAAVLQNPTTADHSTPTQTTTAPGKSCTQTHTHTHTTHTHTHTEHTTNTPHTHTQHTTHP